MAAEDPGGPAGKGRKEGNAEEQRGTLRGIRWARRGSGCTRGVLPLQDRKRYTGVPEPRHSHCSWGHLWHLLWPQAVPMLPQQSSCLVRPGRGLLPH